MPSIARLPRVVNAFCPARSTFLLGLGLGLALLGTRWVRLNLSPSLPCGLYLLRAVPAHLDRGMLVVLPVPPSVQHVWSAWIPLLKPVAGVAGDTVCLEEEVSVGGVGYGPLAHTVHGQPLPTIEQGCQVVQDGRIFLASPMPRSMDSRYFGTVAEAAVTAVATPLATWR
jgi:conjugative transfer signal peptidase TraF